MLQLSPKKPLHHSVLTIPLATLQPLLNPLKQGVGWDEGQSAKSARSESAGLSFQSVHVDLCYFEPVLLTPQLKLRQKEFCSEI